VNNVNPTIAASLAPFFPAVWPNYSGNAVADAERHQDMLADTFTTDVHYLGVDFCVEINRHSRRVVDIVDSNGDDWYYELSASALEAIARKAIAQEEAKL